MNKLARRSIANIAATVVASQAAIAEEEVPVTGATIDAWATELSNAGRWGEDDQLGTLNLITPAVRVHGTSPPHGACGRQ